MNQPLHIAPPCQCFTRPLESSLHNRGLLALWLFSLLHYKSSKVHTIRLRSSFFPAVNRRLNGPLVSSRCCLDLPTCLVAIHLLFLTCHFTIALYSVHSSPCTTCLTYLWFDCTSAWYVLTGQQDTIYHHLSTHDNKPISMLSLINHL